MTTDELQPQRGSDPVQGAAVCASQAAFDTDPQILSFKEAMNLLLGDYVKIFCISALVLVFLGAVAYIRPWNGFM